MSNTLEEILKPDELARMREVGFNPDYLFGVGAYRVSLISLIGNKDGSTADNDIAGDLVRFTTSDGRSMVIFCPVPGIALNLPRGQVIRQDHPSHGTAFVFMPLPMNPNFVYVPFGIMRRVRYETGVSATEELMKERSMHGWFSWEASKGQPGGRLGFIQERWTPIWEKLGEWMPKESQTTTQPLITPL